MDFSILLSPEIQQIIAEYKKKNVSEVVWALQKLPPELRTRIAEQVQGYQKAKIKIPNFCEKPQILFPPKLNLEQASSEVTALWKAENIIGQALTLTDLTGGFGVDSWAFSKVVKQVYYVEQNEVLAQIAQHNFELLGLGIKVFNETAQNYLLRASATDWAYLDPARRNEQGKAIAQIAEMQPNVLEILPIIFKKAHSLLLKASPMLDISQALQILPAVQKVWVLAVENECKEVLFHISQKLYELPNTDSQLPDVSIEAVHIKENGMYSSFLGSIRQEQTSPFTLSPPQKYLYEPNAAILKAGFFRWASAYFGLDKLHKHTHLYTHEDLKSEFQGRVFEILEIIEKVDWKNLSKRFPKAHIIARNYPLSVEQIRKQSRIKEGGEFFLIFTTWTEEQKGIIVARK